MPSGGANPVMGGGAGMDMMQLLPLLMGGGGGGGMGGLFNQNIPMWQKILMWSLFGGGTLSNLLANQKQSSEFNFLRDQQNKLAGTNPSVLSGEVARATQPLNQGLLQSVGNQVQAMMAERGLAEAPGVFGSTMAQALAPYYQQNQQTAEDLVMKQIFGPSQMAGNIPPFMAQPSSMMPLLLSLLSASKGGGGVSNPGLTTGPNPGPDTSQDLWPAMSSGAGVWA